MAVASSLMALFALLLNCSGVGLLYRAWRNKGVRASWYAPTGWALLLLSAWAWILVSGVEFGVVQVCLVSALVAWLLVLVNYRVDSGNGRRASKEPRPVVAATVALGWPRAGAFARQLWLFVVAVPLAGAASAFFTTALLQLLPWQQGDKLVLTLYLVPMVWGLACWWACAVPQSRWPALVFVLATVPSILFLYG